MRLNMQLEETSGGGEVGVEGIGTQMKWKENVYIRCSETYNLPNPRSNNILHIG
jgi:hypothetical protein